ncbi:MAG: MaoC/PaaZ C-terminal domain-containing protein [Actinomycetota bacterium]
MPLDASQAGKTYPAHSFEVTADAIRAYAAATNDENPAYAEERPLVPPAFPVVAVTTGLWAAVMGDEELGVNLARLVHGEEEHLFHAPIRAGDVLTVEGSLESVEARESGETFTILAKMTKDGVLAAELRSVMFIRGKGGRRGAPDPEEELGEPVFVAAQQVDEDQARRYAGASGDANPIHLDPEFARSVGFPGVILHGMCTFAFAARAVLDAVAARDPLRLQRIRMRFSRPVLPGQDLTTKGWLVEDAGKVKTYAFETLNASGSAVIRKGAAEILHRRETLGA